jgi:hypothetical protein
LLSGPDWGHATNGKATRKRSDSKDDRWLDCHISEVKEKAFKLDGFKWLKEESLDDAWRPPAARGAGDGRNQRTRGGGRRVESGARAPRRERRWGQREGEGLRVSAELAEGWTNIVFDDCSNLEGFSTDPSGRA